jgi:hypothetical protein
MPRTNLIPYSRINESDRLRSARHVVFSVMLHLIFHPLGGFCDTFAIKSIDVIDSKNQQNSISRYASIKS